MYLLSSEREEHSKGIANMASTLNGPSWKKHAACPHSSMIQTLETKRDALRSAEGNMNFSKKIDEKETARNQQPRSLSQEYYQLV